jgi:hypothetical protein
MNKQPTYVTFEQAKLLKEKGFDEHCTFIYSLDIVGDTIPHIYPSEDYDHNKNHIWLRPEQWQVVEWLRVEKGIWVYVKLHALDNGVIKYSCRVYNLKLFISLYIEGKAANFVSNSPQEAYSAAFDYALKELI